jgi:hypothetical protein
MPPTQIAAAIENVTAKAMVSHTAPVTRLRLGSIIRSSGLGFPGTTGSAMGSRQVVTKVTSKRWYTSRIIALEGISR